MLRGRGKGGRGGEAEGLKDFRRISLIDQMVYIYNSLLCFGKWFLFKFFLKLQRFEIRRSFVSLFVNFGNGDSLLLAL